MLLLRTIGEILNEFDRQVSKNIAAAKAASGGINRQLPANHPDAVWIEHEGADVLAVLIVLAPYQPVPL
jgi:hypothetical protein